MKGDVFSMFLATIGFICVVVLTFYASKWYAKRMGTISGSKHIHVIDRMAVGKNSAILIIDLEGRQYLLGVNEHRIEIMKELEEPIASETTDKIEGGINLKSFKAYLNRGKKND